MENNKGEFPCRVEAPTTNHVRDCAQEPEKYKVVQIISVYKDKKIMEDCNFR